MSDPAPARMIAILAETPGEPEVLKAVETDTPEPGPGQVLVRVEAAGVNRPDLLQRRGLYPPPPGASEVLGLELAGEIVALGPGVSGRSAGDRVCALTPGGAYAQYCVVDAPLALPIPDGLSAIEAASLPETFFTVWTNVFDDAQLAGDETLLVHGGVSGIGCAAIQLGKCFGDRVFVTCGSEEKCQAAKALGADLAINYKEADFVDAVKEAGGADVVLDMVGGDYVARNLAAMNPGGRHVTIAFLRGPKAEIDLNPILRQRIRLSGSTLRPRTVDQKAEIAAQLLDRVWPRIAAGEIKPMVDSVFPLQEAAQAHARLEAGGHVGKVMLSA